MPRKASGFTLVELMVTIMIVGILATAVMPMAQIAQQREKEKELRLALRQIRQALDDYKQASDEGRSPRRVDESGYPKTLNDLVTGIPDALTPGKRLVFLRRIPRDPMYKDKTVPASETWGLRSYASSYADPQPGNDVFDVYSTSDAIGLDLTPYRSW